MNKIGIKVYGTGITFIDDIDYTVNSINHQEYKDKYRIINQKSFGIELRIKNKKI